MVSTSSGSWKGHLVGLMLALLVAAHCSAMAMPQQGGSTTTELEAGTTITTTTTIAQGPEGQKNESSSEAPETHPAKAAAPPKAAVPGVAHRNDGSTDQSVDAGSSDQSGAISDQSGASVGASGSEAPSVENICMTKDCVTAAADLFQIMDLAADPCQDFEQFACGGFNRDAIIPDDKSKVSHSFDQATDAIDQKGRILLEGLLHEEKKRDDGARLAGVSHEADAKLGRFYGSCINEEAAEKLGVQPLLDILREAGGWPVLEGDKWNGGGSFKWHDMVIHLAKKGIGADWIMSVSIQADAKDIRTRRIYLDQPGLGLSREYLVKGAEAPEVKAYHQFMVDAAKLLGAPADDEASFSAADEMARVLEFETALANITAPREERRDEAKLYNPFHLDRFPAEDNKTPGGFSDDGHLKAYLEELLNGYADVGIKLDDNEKVVVRNVAFTMETMPELLRRTDQRVLANYMGWRLVKEVMEYLNKDAQELKESFDRAVTGAVSKSPRWKTCVQASGFNSYGTSGLTKAAGSLYVRSSFNAEAKNSTKEMIKHIQEAFRNSLEQGNDWMDTETAEKAKLKLDKMHNFVGFVDELIKPEVMNSYFQDLKILEDNYLGNILDMNRFLAADEVKRFREPVDPYDWRDNSLTALVNAFYSPDTNLFQITSGILQSSFYGHGRPKYLNFGGIGSVIGHEITHGFDDQGRQRDHEGSLVDWWSPSTGDNFKERAQCIIDQYGGYKAKEVDLNLNGINTQGENIADNGGIKFAYRGYEKWTEENGPEKRLPGMSFTPKQLFWISYGSVWCTKFTESGLRNQVLTKYHSPGRFRIIGPLSNNKNFAEDFNCPLGSNMNPEKKCSVW